MWDLRNKCHLLIWTVCHDSLQLIDTTPHSLAQTYDYVHDCIHDCVTYDFSKIESMIVSLVIVSMTVFMIVSLMIMSMIVFNNSSVMSKCILILHILTFHFSRLKIDF